MRRNRCGLCEGCTAGDCGECRFCLDKPKFGGNGVMKQCCLQRKCKRLKPFQTQKCKLCLTDNQYSAPVISDSSSDESEDSLSPGNY